MLSTSSWLLITSFFSLWQIPVSHRASSSSISPDRRKKSRRTVYGTNVFFSPFCALGNFFCPSCNHLNLLECMQRKRPVVCIGPVAKNSSGLTYVEQLSCCVILMARTPWGSSSLGSAYASFLCCRGRGEEGRGKCPLELDSLRGGSVCLIMWWVWWVFWPYNPSHFTSLGDALRGEVSKEICFICTDGSLFLFVCVGESDTRDGISFCNTPIGRVCVYLSSGFDVSRAAKLRHLCLKHHWAARQRFLRANLNNLLFKINWRLIFTSQHNSVQSYAET